MDRVNDSSIGNGTVYWLVSKNWNRKCGSITSRKHTPKIWASQIFLYPITCSWLKVWFPQSWSSGLRSWFNRLKQKWDWSSVLMIRGAKRHHQFHNHKSCAWRSRGQISEGEFCDKLKDVYYDTQDVLDEWIENASKINKNVRSFIPAYRFSPKQLVLCLDITDKKNPRLYIWGKRYVLF